MTCLTTREVARGFSETMSQVAYNRARFVITRRNRPVAVLISIADFAQLEERARAKERAA